MSANDDQNSRKALAVRPSNTGYDVGYGKPPASMRFVPGKSGNPKGRPKGSRNRPKLPALNEERMKAIVLQEAYRTIKVNEGAGQVSVPMAQAVIRSLAVNAAKGNQRAQRLFTQLLSTTEKENKRLHDEWLNVAIAYKTEWDWELERRRRLNIVAEPPLPHPDDIVINMKTGQVEIKGPMTKEEKVIWDDLHARLAECERSIAEDEQLLKDDPNYPYRAQVVDNIEYEKGIIAMIAKGLGEKK